MPDYSGLYGKGFNALFTGDGPVTSAPFQNAGRTKGRPLFDQQAVNQAVSNPQPSLTQFDPRTLVKTQPMVTRSGVEHYMNNDSVMDDQSQAGNQHPVVYTSNTGTGGTQHILLSGHHRATKALLAGHPLNAIHVVDPQYVDPTQKTAFYVRSSEEPIWYHASPNKMEPGTSLNPAETSRFKRQTNGDHVYFSLDPYVAAQHVGLTKIYDGSAHLYAVKPGPGIKDDPEAVAKGMQGQSHMAPTATVLHRLEPEDAWNTATSSEKVLPNDPRLQNLSSRRAFYVRSGIFDDEPLPPEENESEWNALKEKQNANAGPNRAQLQQAAHMDLKSQGYQGNFDQASRRAFVDHVDHHFAQADAATNGYLLNPAGIAKKINPKTLFHGNPSFAHAYASDELKDHWNQHGRPEYNSFRESLITGSGDGGNNSTRDWTQNKVAFFVRAINWEDHAAQTGEQLELKHRESPGKHKSGNEYPANVDAYVNGQYAGGLEYQPNGDHKFAPGEISDMAVYQKGKGIGRAMIQHAIEQSGKPVYHSPERTAEGDGFAAATPEFNMPAGYHEQYKAHYNSDNWQQPFQYQPVKTAFFVRSAALKEAVRYWNGFEADGSPYWQESPEPPGIVQRHQQIPSMGDKKLPEPYETDNDDEPHAFDPNQVWWHGSASNDYTKHGAAGLHVGTYHAAREALTNMVGHRADNKDWDGTSPWSQTLLMGQRNQVANGHKLKAESYTNSEPMEDYRPADLAAKDPYHPFSSRRLYSGAQMNGDFTPSLFPVKLSSTAKMHPFVKSDATANQTMEMGSSSPEAMKMKQPGMYYLNEAEDKGSASVALPHHSMIQRVDPATVQKPDFWRHAGNDQKGPLLKQQVQEAGGSWVDGRPPNTAVASNEQPARRMGSMEKSMREALQVAIEDHLKTTPVPDNVTPIVRKKQAFFVRSAAPKKPIDPANIPASYDVKFPHGTEANCVNCKEPIRYTSDYDSWESKNDGAPGCGGNWDMDRTPHHPNSLVDTPKQEVAPTPVSNSVAPAPWEGTGMSMMEWIRKQNKTAFFVRQSAPILRPQPMDAKDYMPTNYHPDYEFSFHPHDPASANPSHVPVDVVHAWTKAQGKAGIPVGTLKLQHADNGDNAPRGLVNWIAVDEAHKGKGLGASMMDHAQKNGQTPIHDDWNTDRVSESGAQFIDNNRRYPMLKTQYAFGNKTAKHFFVRTSNKKFEEAKKRADFLEREFDHKTDNEDIVEFQENTWGQLPAAERNIPKTQSAWTTFVATYQWGSGLNRCREIRRAAWALIGEKIDDITADPHIDSEDYGKFNTWNLGEDPSTFATYAYTLMKGIEKNPKSMHKAFRGIGVSQNIAGIDEFLDEIEVHRTFDMPLVAFSTREGATNEFGTEIHFHLEAGAQGVVGLQMDPELSASMPGYHDKDGNLINKYYEYIVGGKFQVTDIKKSGKKSCVYIKQIEIFDPDRFIKTSSKDDKHMDMKKFNHLFEGEPFHSDKRPDTTQPDKDSAAVVIVMHNIPKKAFYVRSAQWNWNNPEQQLHMTLDKTEPEHQYPGYDRVNAFVNGNPAGHMIMAPQRVTPDSPHGPGEIADLLVAPEHRRKGLAGEMASYAQENDIWPKHSDRLTPDGAQFAKSTPGLGFTRKRSAYDDSNPPDPNAIAAGHKVLHRGMKVQLEPHEWDHINKLMQPPMEQHEIDQHHQIGSMLLNKIQSYNNPNMDISGIGRHWTTKKDWAHKAADNGLNGGLPVVVSGTWDGNNEDMSKTNSGMKKNPDGSWIPNGEEETTLMPGARMNIHSVRIPEGQGYREVLGKPVQIGNPEPKIAFFVRANITNESSIRIAGDMTQPNKPQFVRTTPAGNQLSLVQGQGQEDPTNGMGYSPMSEDDPKEILLNPPPVRPGV